MPNPYAAEWQETNGSKLRRLDGEITFTDPGNQPGPGTGGVNSVTAGDASITVAGTLPDPTIAVSALGIVSGKIAALAVTTAKIALKAVGAAQMGSGAATSGQVPTADGAGGVAYADLPIKSVAAGDGSIVVGGTSANPTLETADLATIASLHAASGAVAMNSKKITGLADGTNAQDAAAFHQIPTALPPNGAAGGDLGGSYPSPDVEAIQGVAVSATSPASGQVLTAADATHAAWATLAGTTLDTAQYTGGQLLITATTDATATTICTGSGVTLDGLTSILVTFYAVAVDTPAVATANITLVLYDGSTDLGRIGFVRAPTAATYRQAIIGTSGVLTPSAATHTYSIRAFVTSGTGAVYGGVGGAGVNMPSTMIVSAL